MIQDCLTPTTSQCNMVKQNSEDLGPHINASLSVSTNKMAVSDVGGLLHLRGNTGHR